MSAFQHKKKRAASLNHNFTTKLYIFSENIIRYLKLILIKN